jgi:pyridoxine 5-phosphate synthase
VHTGNYANAKGEAQQKELVRVVTAVKTALDLGMGANAGHGLNYHNVQGVAAIGGLRGLYIGHSIISRAVLAGMERAVRDMKDVIHKAESRVPR